LEGALAYAERTWPASPVIVLGSSYSASLVFFLAAEHANEVATLLAFSPGEYFGGHPVREQVARVQCPVFVTSSPNPEEVAAAKRLFDGVPSPDKTRYVPTHGVHGASALRIDTNAQGASEVWAHVEAFLDSLPLRRDQ
jgi:pimeloyl-ACP methyl ester carboxylesterase